MSKPTPYSYVTSGGVANTRVKVAEDATLADLAEANSAPTQLDVTSIEYHNRSKREQGRYKQHLNYFVGGVLDGKRIDSNITERTLLTLDVEQGKNDDSPPPKPDAVVLRLGELGAAGWVYTSLSHTPGSPRYRVVLPLGRPIRGDAAAMLAALQASTQAAARKLGIEKWTKPESWVLSQPMYLPAKLKGGTFYQSITDGKSWSTVAPNADLGKVGNVPADIPDERPDPLLSGIKAAGLYLREDPDHKGKHYIVCPFSDEHGVENDTQTVYYEPHYDGNPRPAVKCFDTEPDIDGKPHLTLSTLTRYLRKGGHLSASEEVEAAVLDDDDVFLEKANLQSYLEQEPIPREWAIEQLAPVGKVTVIAGPGGVSKSMMMLHILMYAALGNSWGPFAVTQPVRSLYVSYEDDKQEMHKRVHSLAGALKELDDGVFDALYDVEGSLRRNLLMYAADDDAANWLISKKSEDRFGPPERTERVEWLVGFLRRQRVQVLVLDPAVYTHQLEENNIADMAAYMQTLSYIAKQARCSVVVLHHMGKAQSWLSLDEINQGALRGASSFADNARSVGVLVSLPIKDAARYSLPEDHETSTRYAVFKHVKHNYSASLGTHVFERRGPMLVPRPDITRLDGAALAEAKERQKLVDDEARATSYQGAILQYLVTMDDFCTLNQIAEGAHVHKRRIRALLEAFAEEDLVETEAGARGALTARITKAGRKWLKEND